MSKNKKKILIIFIFLTLTLVSTFVINQYEKRKVIIAPKVEKIIKEKKESDYLASSKNLELEKEEYINDLPKYREQYNNQNIIAKLDIPNLNISTLITRSDNNTFYLDHNLYNQRDNLGVPFVDFRNTDLTNEKQINIYGHNTKNKRYYDQLPFVILEAYVDENIFRNYKEVYLSIDDKRIKYEVVAIKIIAGNDNEHMKVKFNSEFEFSEHLSKLLKNLLYEDDKLEINVKDNILILQVCHYKPENTYLLVICKEKKD